MDSEWLKTQLRLAPGRTKAELAAALGLGPPAVSKMLAGARQIKAHEYVAMRRFFGLPVDGERAAGFRSAGQRDSYVLRPLEAGFAEKPGEQHMDDAWVMPASLLRGRAAASPENIRLFTVNETAMTPDFQPGECVLVDLADRIPSPPGLFLVSDGLGHIIRQVEYMPHSAPPAVRMSARSAAYEPYITPMDKAGLVGRVIAKLQWL